MLEIARKVCAELEGSTILIITQQPFPLHTSHFTAEVKDQVVVLLSQGRLPAPLIIPGPFHHGGEMGTAVYACMSCFT